MKTISSFTIDHEQLLRGVYVSRAEDGLTTFDIRICAPYLDKPMEADVIHTIEHIGATLLRNDDMWDYKIIYFGPMGCQTGFYLIVQGYETSMSILPLLKRVFRGIAEWNKPIPGATKKECGNYQLQNLEGAKAAAKKYLDEILDNIYPANINYPKTEK